MIRVAAAALMLLALALPCAARAQDDDEAAQVFARMDANRDGQVSLEEFEKGIARPYGADSDGVVYQRLPARFRALDSDGDGYLDDVEYDDLIVHWRGPGSAPMLVEADLDRDGRLDFREFVRIYAPKDAGGATAGDAPPPDSRAEPSTSGRARSPRASKNSPMRRTV